MQDNTFPSQNARYRYLQKIVSEFSDGVLLIETDRSIIWANDTALDMHGVRRVDELGPTVFDYCRRFDLRYRNGDRIEQGRTPIERVLAGETFDQVVVDVAPAGEDEARWTHRVRSLVLHDDDGKRDLLVLIFDDETERYNAEERFERAFNANPAPALITRLRDLRHIRVNQGFLDMTGCREEQVVGKSIYEVDVLEGAARREFGIERLQAGRTIPQMEAVMQLPQGGERCVIVAGQPIQVGDMRCMLFTFADLEGRRQAERELRRSEERFELAFRMAPLPIAILVRHGWRLLLVNDAFARETGHEAAALLGREAATVPLWSDAAALERGLARDGRVAALSMAMQTRDGGTLDCLVSAELTEIHGDSCVLLVAQNVADRQRSKLEVADAIASVMQDTSWFTEAVLDKLARQGAGAAEPATGSLAALPPRAREVLELACEGLDDDAIAARLAVARNTVRNHVAGLYRRTGVDSRAKLIIWARERGVSGTGARRRTPDRTRGD